MTSELLKVMYSKPSLPLKSLPAYLEYKTVFPGVTDKGFILPSSSRVPGPTATTCRIQVLQKCFSDNASLIEKYSWEIGQCQFSIKLCWTYYCGQTSNFLMSDIMKNSSLTLTKSLFGLTNLNLLIGLSTSEIVWKSV